MKNKTRQCTVGIEKINVSSRFVVAPPPIESASRTACCRSSCFVSAHICDEDVTKHLLAWKKPGFDDAERTKQAGRNSLKQSRKRTFFVFF